ncbi:MMPL family transporter [Actinosynnema sp. NPDC047251]|uniref:Putative membrane protein n=1 Tax=Saccharothrix espanaensis (strain ATCC 51144 / DSM 44229 / JCM 9112 / NBRC 15066 / NRRL 15764) TaxID=1179773 RepID=K0KBZ2_SACES|nr:MMPL family transporter [Saccharothrix espanaensis]CCH35721.1 putative membrane protein [Saccharothrix espanaensis DSM 44229]
MFANWGSLAYRRRWVVLIATVVLAVAGGVWGLGVFDKLSQGGYDAPSSESARANQVAQDAFGRQGGDVVVVYDTVDPAQLGRISEHLSGLPQDAVLQVQPPLPSAEAGKSLVAITLRGSDSNTHVKQYEQIADRLAVDGVTQQVGGLVPTQKAINDMSASDMAKAEAVSLPIVLILLVIIFGGLVAASLPVAVGGLSIMGSLGVLHAVSLGTEVNSFAVNVASLLGLGMAIDYGLFMVGRFREELAAGRSTEDAVKRTVLSAGRTVAFSATLLVIALSGLLLFPHGFLKSLSYGGMSAVAIAALVSLTLLPALLGILGHRVDKLSVPWRRDKVPSEQGWRKLAGRVMKRPVLFALPIVGVLVALGAPFLGVQFGEVSEKVLPEGNAARVAAETVNRDFAGLASGGMKVVLTGDPAQADVQAFIAEVGDVPGVGEVRIGAEPNNGVWLLNAGLEHDQLSDESKQALKDVRALAPPGSGEVLVGGSTAMVSDSLDAIKDKLPWMVLLLVGATFVLMFLAFGSVLLPIKAVVVSALSLSATFGVLVWVFQDGHGASLLGVTPAPLESGIVVLMAAMVFGLSTDYEVFLLSRMVEARGRGASTEEAVTAGLAKTGRVITAAALLLIVVTGAFAFSQITMMRFVGVGMILALALDATVVRMLLVPAVLKLLGDAAWWAPGPLRRIQERLAIHEDAPPVEEERVPARV